MRSTSWCACRHNGYFVDLFVRSSNKLAITMYTKLGYTTYRRVLGYYSGTEDALGALVLFVRLGCYSAVSLQTDCPVISGDDCIMLIATFPWA